jgi:hypothetical protein
LLSEPIGAIGSGFDGRREREREREREGEGTHRRFRVPVAGDKSVAWAWMNPSMRRPLAMVEMRME